MGAVKLRVIIKKVYNFLSTKILLKRLCLQLKSEIETTILFDIYKISIYYCEVTMKRDRLYSGGPPFDTITGQGRMQVIGEEFVWSVLTLSRSNQSNNLVM